MKGESIALMTQIAIILCGTKIILCGAVCCLVLDSRLKYSHLLHLFQTKRRHRPSVCVTVTFLRWPR